MITKEELQRRFDLYAQGYWDIPEGLDTSNFDFNWRPDSYDRPYIHQFGTQHQKTGGPRFIIPENEGIKYQSFQHAKKLPDLNNRSWRPLLPNVRIDYSWHPDDTEPPFIYVFGNQWYDSIGMPTIQYRIKGATDKKYITDFKAEIIIDSIIYQDSIYDCIMQHNFNTDYAHFRRENSTDIDYTTIIESIRDIGMHLIDNVEVIVHKDTVKKLYDNLTDYPYVKHHTLGYSNSPMDIIFISNGETIADENYEHLLKITKDKPNRVIRIDKVNGRVASQHAAANASNTEWYFLVNGKLRVNENFDFNWQPDRYTSRKHYVFTATNPINNLEYGHMAIVANNKKLTLATTGKGLDFTMDSPIKSVPINSGIAVFNSSPWDTWRTAFREVIKLCDSKDKESKNRLIIWTNIAEGNFAQECLQGAKEAVEYYNQVNDDFEKLKLSYDWDWLYQKYNK
jgi:hypothetical protein